MAFDDLEFEVFEMEHNLPLPSAFAVKHELPAHSLARSQEQRYVEDNAVVVVLLEHLEEDLPTWPISTWSCYCCRISQLSLELEALYLMEKRSEVQQPQAVAWVVVDHIPSCRATVAVVALPVGEASLEAAWRDLDLELMATMNYYVSDRDSTRVVAGMTVRPRNEGSFRRVFVAERTRKRHTQGFEWD